MTREEAKTLLGENATEEAITNLLNKFHENDETYKKQISDAQKETEKLQKEVSKYSDYDNIKRQLDDINKANMTEQEKLVEREKNVAKLEQEANRRNNRSIVKEVVSGLGLSDEVIESLVNDDADISRKNAENLLTQINAIKEATIKATKDELINVDVKPNTQDAVQPTTKTWKDYTSDEKLLLKRNNPQEYELLKQTMQD